MRKLVTVIVLISLGFMSYAQDEIVGTWMANEGRTIVEVYQNETGYYAGKIVWLEKPTNRKGEPHTDRMNRDKALRDRNIMGMDMLESLEYRNGKWYGTLYSPKNGRKVDAELSLNGNDQLDINVSFRGFTRKVAWTRTELPK